ncbi:MAG: DNA-directed RNA polymerase subunit alpha [Armatimonadetes bacterium]|nr:DNA-directed RNA polymerase subunit alpha [Armatimonadota bacterium]
MDMAIKPEIKTLEQSESYCKLLVEPLERGFGSTLGNALRRVLLSTIPGAAITSIKIDGVLHEFSTIPGVKEDTTELILNLKDIALRVPGDGYGDRSEPRTIRIDKRGEGEVTGADIEGEVDVMNPSVHIATMSEESSRLSMEMTVEVGMGYVPPDKQEHVKQSIGVLPIPSVFSPVKRVNYIVEATRVGHKTDYDRLVLEVWTNGTVRPKNAVVESARILDSYFKLFFDVSTEIADDGQGGDLDLEEISEAFRDAKIEELDFSVRTYNCLKKASVLTIGDLVQKSENDLMTIRNFGRKSLTEVREKLGQLGLNLRRSREEPTFDEDADDEDDGSLDEDYGSSDEADEEEE